VGAVQLQRSEPEPAIHQGGLPVEALTGTLERRVIALRVGARVDVATADENRHAETDHP
jgi:hypothetical protein